MKLRSQDSGAENSYVASRALVPLSTSVLTPISSSTSPGSVAVRPGRSGLLATEMHVDVANNTDCSMMCAFTATSNGREIPFAPQYEWIDPYTTGTVALRVPWKIRTLAVRLLGSGTDYAARADVPRARVFWLAAALPILAALAVAMAAWLRPGIASFSIPQQAYAGTSVSAAYAVRGVGAARYRVSEGTNVIAQGALSVHSGSFAFNTSNLPKRYDVWLSVSGPAGSAGAHQVVSTLMRPQAQIPASIGSLTIAPGVAVSGKPFIARYASNAVTGDLKLIDDKGITWDAQPYRAQGTTAFIAPHVDSPSHFVVRLAVRRASSLASAESGLVVMPATPSPSPSPADLASIAAPPEASVITIPQHLVSGAKFTVRAQSAQDGVLSGTVTLQGENGMDFSSAPAGPTQPVAFTAPAVKRLTRYYIVATLVRAKSSQLVVTPISVYPAVSP